MAQEQARVQSRVPPVMRTQSFEAGEYTPHDSDGPVLDFVTLRMAAPEVNVEDHPASEFKERVEFEQFMQQPVIIELARTSEPNEPPAVFLSLNNEGGWLPRGKKIRLRRCFLECLIQAQKASYIQYDNPNPQADEMKITERVNGQSYHFAVIHDPDPRGRRWFERVMRAAR